MTRIKLTNGFPKKKGAPLRLATIILEGDLQAEAQIELEDGSVISILTVTPINIVTNERRAILTVPAEPEVAWHQFYGQELRVKTLKPAV